MKLFRIGALCFSLFALVFGLVLFNTSASRVVESQTTADEPSAPAAIQLQQVLAANNLSSPVYVTNAKDLSNRLFIVQQGGIIKVLQPGANTTTDFLNITPKVLSGGERGLLGLAFHPQFAINRRFFVYYTRQTNGDLQISEFKASTSNPNVADTAEISIITIPHSTNSNHNGGMLEFGSDGYLYIGTGDGGAANDPPNNAQNINQLLGKMLRLNVDPPTGTTAPYVSPSDNPFFGATAGADEIYMMGLRNPWRWSFDRANPNQLWIADVGQGAFEEINRVDLNQTPTSGARNFGWRRFEGTQCTNLDRDGNNQPICTPFANQINPVAQYSHNNNRCSITGGYAYRGRRGVLPQGTYVFSDFCTGEIFTLQGSTPTLLINSGGNVSSFGEDEYGEIYACYGGGIFKLVDSAVPVPANEKADFDGDFRSDLSVYRGGTWYTNSSFNSSAITISQFGLNTDIPVPGDYDKDGKTDIAVYRPSEGNWYYLRSSDGTFVAFHWGTTGDIPAVGDYDGDKQSDYAVYRPNTGTWYIYNIVTNGTTIQQWGLSTDQVVQGDYTGDGKTDLAVWRPSNGFWYILPSGGGNAIFTQWGTNGDIALNGDFDGDDKNDLAVYRPGTNFWFISRSSDGTALIFAFGTGTDIPVPADYDGDRKDDIAVFRNGTWYILRSFNNQLVIRQFGTTGDIPVPVAY